MKFQEETLLNQITFGRVTGLEVIATANATGMGKSELEGKEDRDDTKASRNVDQ